MERTKRLPSSIRKYIRRQKARIRREFLDVKKQEEAIEEVYKALGVPKPEPKKGLAKQGIKEYSKNDERQRHIQQPKQRADGVD